MKAAHTEGVDLSDRSLIPAHVECVEGLIFVCFGEKCPDFELARKTIGTQVQLANTYSYRIAIPP